MRTGSPGESGMTERWVEGAVSKDWVESVLGRLCMGRKTSDGDSIVWGWREGGRKRRDRASGAWDLGDG